METHNRFRPLLDLPTADAPTGFIKRSVSMRVRFLGDRARQAARSFCDHGGGARFLWNAAVRYIGGLRPEEQSSAYNMDLLNKKFITERLYATKPLVGQGAKETAEAFETRKRKRDSHLGRVGELVIGEFVRLHPWLANLHSSVKQQVFWDLVKAFRAGLAKNRARRKRGQSAQIFTIKRKQLCNPSSWTFCLPAQQIHAEHVPRPTNGAAVQGQTQAQGMPRTWTKLTLPAALGGVEGLGKKHVAGVVYLTKRAPLNGEGKLLGNVRFTRNRLGRWSAVVQRVEVKPKPRPPPPERKTVFLDPGTRAGNAYYSPDTAETGAYMEGTGGVDTLFSLALRVDKLVSSCKPGGERVNCRRRRREVRAVPEDREHREYVYDAKKAEYRLRAEIYNKVRDAHKRVAKDLTSRFDTIVVPKFDTQKMVRRARDPDDRVRLINNKTARCLLTLSHYAFRSYLQHRCAMDGAEFVLATEEYTTKACPYCGSCYEVGTAKVFRCPRMCDFTADRDEKAAFALCVKYARC